MPTILNTTKEEQIKIFIILIILTAIGWIIFRFWYDVVLTIFYRLIPKKYNTPPLWMKVLVALAFTSLLLVASLWIGILPF